MRRGVEEVIGRKLGRCELRGSRECDEVERLGESK